MIPTVFVPVILASLIAGVIGLLFAIRERRAQRVGGHTSEVTPTYLRSKAAR